MVDGLVFILVSAILESIFALILPVVSGERSSGFNDTELIACLVIRESDPVGKSVGFLSIGLTD